MCPQDPSRRALVQRSELASRRFPPTRAQLYRTLLHACLLLLSSCLLPARAFMPPYSGFGLAGSECSKSLLIRCGQSTAGRSSSQRTQCPARMSLDQAVLCLSTVTSILGFYTYETCPSGFLAVGPDDVVVKVSSVEGAGLGLFAARDLPAGTLLGSYPGCAWPASRWLQLKGLQPQDIMLPPAARRELQEQRQTRAREYVWKLESGFVIDPTSATGEIADYVPWIGNALFSSGAASSDIDIDLALDSSAPLLKACPPASKRIAGPGSYPTSTILCRINEPERGGDVNVETEEVKGAILFRVERAVKAGVSE